MSTASTPETAPAPPRPKVFCIGRNKTGTTSLKAALAMLGYRTGSQAAGEMLLPDWTRRDFRRLFRFCQGADAFKDIPFSLDYTFQAVDLAFRGSRFILTVRTTPEEWYQSYLRFHTQVIGKGSLPDAQALKQHDYRFPGYFWLHQTSIFGVDERTLYDREIYIRNYLDHNARVIDYFRYRPSDLLVLNVGDDDAMTRLCAFLGLPGEGHTMPHLNRTRRDTADDEPDSV